MTLCNRAMKRGPSRTIALRYLRWRDFDSAADAAIGSGGRYRHRKFD